jgi:hypothetical protein
VLAHAQQPSVGSVLDGVNEAADRLDLTLEIAMVQESAGIEPASAAVSAAGARGLVIRNSPIFGSAQPQITALALTHRLASISSDLDVPRGGGLLAYSVNRHDNYRHAAPYVDRILKGARFRCKGLGSQGDGVAHLSVTTRSGVTSVSAMARSKQARAATALRRSEKYTSTTCPSWSIAR